MNSTAPSAAMMRERAEAFLMTADPLHQLSIRRIIDFLTHNRLPGMFLTREVVVAGGFMSYGASLPELFRHGASYVHRILQGEGTGQNRVILHVNGPDELQSLGLL